MIFMGKSHHKNLTDYSFDRFAFPAGDALWKSWKVTVRRPKTRFKNSNTVICFPLFYPQKHRLVQSIGMIFSIFSPNLWLCHFSHITNFMFGCLSFGSIGLARSFYFYSLVFEEQQMAFLIISIQLLGCFIIHYLVP